MSEKILREIQEKKALVGKEDRDAVNKNKEYYRSLWLNLIVLSSAIIIGMLPVINDNKGLLKSVFLAKLGLLIIVLVIILGMLYYNSTLAREQSMLFELWQLHEKIFTNQLLSINSSNNESKTEAEINELFSKAKQNAFQEETKARAKHLVGGKLYKIRIKIDKHISNLLIYLFLIGSLILISSFINF